MGLEMLFKKNQGCMDISQEQQTFGSSYNGSSGCHRVV
jgi:hypothetical protein